MRETTTIAAAVGLALLLAPLAARADDPGGHAAAAVDGAGAEVYQGVCKACHMADAKGASGAAVIPALAGNTHLSVPAYPVILVLNGRGAMPGFKDMLSPAQIAAVASYVRTHFGNHYAKPVGADLVATLSQPQR